MTVRHGQQQGRVPLEALLQLGHSRKRGLVLKPLRVAVTRQERDQPGSELVELFSMLCKDLINVCSESEQRLVDLHRKWLLAVERGERVKFSTFS